MTELTQDLSLAQAYSLIDSYDFDLGGDDAKILLQSWLREHHASWIRLATIEALYQGRYKAVSITQILSVWSRIGTPNTHFTYEFERLICRKLPKHLTDISSLTTSKLAAVSESDLEFDSGSYCSLESADSQNEVSTAKDKLHSETSNTTAAKSSYKAVDEIKTANSAKAVRESIQRSHSVSIASALGFSCQTDWSEFGVEQTVIHQFIPLPDVSSFFNKLKTFGEEKLEH